ncbi:MAG: 2-isopropylmalate synthase [Candidatus Melainabacteria bacterium]|nr:MAG: 2-isopropylmalate synthase [Candidatus Melainabacteria bacterium]
MTDDYHIRIFDTTLRDGQQCPGAGMSFEKNIEYARLASKLRIDVLEAGFPSASKVDFEIVNTIAQEFGTSKHSPVIAALCQLREEQVIKTIEALKPAVSFGKARLHTYVPVDPVLMPASLGDRAEDKAGIIKDLYKLVKMARQEGLEVEFSPEGYSKMSGNFDFVTELIRAAISAGAAVINCPDTIGGASVFEGEEYFVRKMSHHAEIMKKEFPKNQIIWSVHCHNDFGLAVQNSCNAVFHGPARQIEGCINGIGERAGNASLEQCIVLIEHFGKRQNGQDQKPYYTTIATEYLQSISDYVSINMLPRQPHSPVCGDNAAKHSSGGHTNAVLKNPLAYQPFDPREIGKDISLLFGPMSGGNHAKSIIEKSGYVCDDSEKAEIAQFIKDRYKARRKGITDKELIEMYFEFRNPIVIERFDYSRTSSRAELILHGKFYGQKGEFQEFHEGKDSALAALKKLIEKHSGEEFEILGLRSQSDVTGINANSVTKISIMTNEAKVYDGTGVDQDLEISAMKALIDAVNRAYIVEHFSLNKSVKSYVTEENTEDSLISA